MRNSVALHYADDLFADWSSLCAKAHATRSIEDATACGEAWGRYMSAYLAAFRERPDPDIVNCPTAFPTGPGREVSVCRDEARNIVIREVRNVHDDQGWPLPEPPGEMLGFVDRVITLSILDAVALSRALDKVIEGDSR